MLEIPNYLQVIISIVVSIITVYKTFFKKNSKRENEYYQSVLQPFVKRMKKQGSAYAIKKLKKCIKRDDDNIPKYIFYLIDKADSQKDSSKTDRDLEKVLLYDYCELYPNSDSKFHKILDMGSRILNYLMIFVAFFCVLVSVTFISMILAVGLKILCIR